MGQGIFFFQLPDDILHINADGVTVRVRTNFIIILALRNSAVNHQAMVNTELTLGCVSPRSILEVSYEVIVLLIEFHFEVIQWSI